MPISISKGPFSPEPEGHYIDTNANIKSFMDHLKDSLNQILAADSTKRSELCKDFDLFCDATRLQIKLGHYQPSLNLMGQVNDIQNALDNVQNNLSSPQLPQMVSDALTLIQTFRNRFGS